MPNPTPTEADRKAAELHARSPAGYLVSLTDGDFIAPIRAESFLAGLMAERQRAALVARAHNPHATPHDGGHVCDVDDDCCLMIEAAILAGHDLPP